MSEESSNTVLTAEELDAAIAEIEAIPAEEKGVIPCLDDGSESKVVQIPVPTPGVKTESESAPRSSEVDEAQPESPPGKTEPPSSEEKSKDPAPSSDAPPGLKHKFPRFVAGLIGGLRQRLGRLPLLGQRREKTSDPPAAAPAPKPDVPAEPVEPAEPTVSVPPTNLLLRLLDKVLELINRPFHWVPQSARNILGLAGVVTIIVSLVVLYVLPLVMTREDPISFIHRKRAEQIVVPTKASVEQPADPPPESPSP